jgi:hypothetical protein
MTSFTLKERPKSIYFARLNHDGVVALLELDLDSQLGVADHDLRVRKLLLQVKNILQRGRTKPEHPVGLEDQRLSREDFGVEAQFWREDRLLTGIVRTKLLTIKQI